MEVNELTQFLLTSRGSGADDPLSRRRGAAVVRAALEAEKLSESNRFEDRRGEGLFLIALSKEGFGEVALDYAEKLATAARQMASTDPLPSPARVQETLRAVPSSLPALQDGRLVRLAAAVARVAVSPRLELYPKGLDALRALKLAQSAVAGQSPITPDELADRVRERYPEAAELPNHPALDEMVREAGLSLTWRETDSSYVAPTPPPLESSASLQRQETVVSPWVFVQPIEVPPEIEAAKQFERRLQAAYRAPSYLVLATDPKFDHIQMAQSNLARHFPMAVFHCEREMLAAIRAEAESQGVRWEVILRADSAPPDSRDGQNLLRLVGKAAETVAEKLRDRKESTLVMFPGLLARYGQIAILDDLQDFLGERSLWVLVGSERQAASPMADGQAIPARPTQWAWIPPKWLDNDFRKYRGGAA